MTFELVLAPEAESDIDEILEWSVVPFGTAIRDGYEAMIEAAIRTLAIDPNRAGSHDRPDLGRGIRTPHLSSSRDDVSHDVRKTAKPRHFVIYRQVGDAVQVVRLLHDAMDLPEHGWVYFRQIDSRAAAQKGELTVAARR